MNIQSLSIVVPIRTCINNCLFCISKMHNNVVYNNSFDLFQIEKRIKYAISNNTNTVILTGTGEVLQNRKFLGELFNLFEKLNHPFSNVELQTTGTLLGGNPDLPNKNNHFINRKPNIKTLNHFYDNIKLIKSLGVNTISLSVSNIFDDLSNMKYIGVPKKIQFKLKELINILKDEGFNIRLSVNMTSSFDEYNAIQILNKTKELGANQITFRKLYFSKDFDSIESKWVEENSCHPNILELLKQRIQSKGTPLYKLPYGPIVYSYDDMSIVLDDDCMGKENINALKHIILRQDSKLYCKWDDLGSLIF